MKKLMLLFAVLISSAALFAQNVGIDQTNPANKLDVNGNLSVGSTYSGIFTAPTNGAIFEGRVGVGQAAPASKLDVNGGLSVGSTYSGTSTAPANGAIFEGRVGVGTDNPVNVFQVDGVLGNFSDGGIRLENTSGQSGWSLYPSAFGNLLIGKISNLGTFDATSGAYSATSDARLKTDIKPLENVLSNLIGLEMKRYKYIYNNPSNKEFIGLLAQDLQTKYPEFVSVNPTNEGNTELDNQLGVDYAGLSVLAIKAIQEQQEIINALTARLEALERKLSDK